MRTIPVDGQTNVYVPEGGGPFPGLVVVHGGSWAAGNKEAVLFQCQQLAINGYVALARDYPLSAIGTKSFPEAPDDIGLQVRRMRAMCAAWKVAVARVGVVGTSAGGTIAFQAARRGIAGDTRPDAVAALSGPTDLEDAYHNPVELDAGVSSADAIGLFLGGTTASSPEAIPSTYASADPIENAVAGLPPIWLGHGATEFGTSQMATEQTAYAAALAAAGVTVTRKQFTGSGHGSQNVVLGLIEIIAFMAAHL